MQSESARSTSREEARFRVDYPNSKPRAVKVVALDVSSERLLRKLTKSSRVRAGLFTSLAFENARPDVDKWSVGGWLSDLVGQTKNLIDEVKSAELVVMISTAGAEPRAAEAIGQICSLNRVMVTALILDTASASEEALSQTLTRLRPYATMLVVANGDEYVEAMLDALQA